MIEKMVSKQLLNEAQKEYYSYAGISIIERGITIGTICVLRLITNAFIYTAFFLVFFLELRLPCIYNEELIERQSGNIKIFSFK